MCAKTFYVPLSERPKLELSNELSNIQVSNIIPCQILEYAQRTHPEILWTQTGYLRVQQYGQYVIICYDYSWQKKIFPKSSRREDMDEARKHNLGRENYFLDEFSRYKRLEKERKPTFKGPGFIVKFETDDGITGMVLDMTINEYWDPEKFTVDNNGIATPKIMEKDLTNIAADIFGNDFEEGTKLMHEAWQN